jgi:acetoin utilization protein AcuB
MQVKRWMTTPVITVPEDCPAVLAFRKMLENQIRRLPVVDEDGALVGIVTDRDLRGLALQTMDHDPELTSAEVQENELRVTDVMTTDVITVASGDDVRDAALRMLNNRFTGLPVVDGGALVGIITVHDLMEVLVAALEREEKARSAG